MTTGTFILHSPYTPAGDQPEAIARLVSNIEHGVTHQTLQGITGSGKTFTMANVIHRLKRPTLILAPNKTLTAQLYGEMKQFFPENAVEYFVSYYDYFQPEVYIPGSDRFIQKDSAINEHLERLRLSTTKALIERRDVIVVASVSSIYGLGDPAAYRALQIPLAAGMDLSQTELLRRLALAQYERTERVLRRATFRVKDQTVDVFPADAEHWAVRVVFSGPRIESVQWIDPVTAKTVGPIEQYRISPKTLFAPPSGNVQEATEKILADLQQRVAELSAAHRLVEADRLYERVTNDVQSIRDVGYCAGMENYASYFSGRDPAAPPVTLMDYLPKDGLLFVDESHVMVPQIGAMYRGDQARKETLIDYGFRLPSSMANRPLSFGEFEHIKPQTIFVSATPGEYERKVSKGHWVEQIIRPTGLLDPVVQVRQKDHEWDDLRTEIAQRVRQHERVLVTTLTKAGAEALAEFLADHGIRARYLHSDIKAQDRVAIIDGLRAGEFDVLIGISLLREGLDIPEASLVAILDADRAGFLRSAQALIQMIGRVARHRDGTAILYADTVTPAMRQAIDETNRRRQLQMAFNAEHGISPVSSARKLASEEAAAALAAPTAGPVVHSEIFCATLDELCDEITAREQQLLAWTDAGDEARVEAVRHQLDGLYRQFILV